MKIIQAIASVVYRYLRKLFRREYSEDSFGVGYSEDSFMDMMGKPNYERIQKAIMELIDAKTPDQMHGVFEKNKKELAHPVAQNLIGNMLEVCKDERLARRLEQCFEFLFYRHKEFIKGKHPGITRHPGRIIGITNEGNHILEDSEGNHYVDRPDRNSSRGR